MLSIRHYALGVRLEFPPPGMPGSAPGSIAVKARLQVENNGTAPASILPLLFYRLHKVSNVRVDGTPAETNSRITGLEGRDRHQVNAVTVELPQPLPPGATCSVDLEYGGVTAGAREVWPYMWDSVTRDYVLLRPDAIWYPVAGLPDLASYHRAFRIPKHFDVTVQVPEGFLASAPGVVTTEPGVTRFRTTAPRERFDLAVAPFTRLESGGVSVYYLPGDATWGTAVLGWVNAALSGLSERLGPRGTGSLAIVQIPLGWGSQSSPELILQEPGAADDWVAAAAVLHEVSHFWTPAPADWPRRFSDESLACFFQYLLVGALFGAGKAEEQLDRYQRSVNRTQGAAATRFLDGPISDDQHNTVWYAKGALALHRLRDLLGEERFWPLLKEYTAEDEATTQGFAKLLRQRYPSAETEAFLRDWFG